VINPTIVQVPVVEVAAQVVPVVEISVEEVVLHNVCPLAEVRLYSPVLFVAALVKVIAIALVKAHVMENVIWETSRKSRYNNFHKNTKGYY